MAEIISWLLDISMLIAEWIIVVILLDDIYGLTSIRRVTKRRLRKYWRKFWRDSKKYHRKNHKK